MGHKSVSHKAFELDLFYDAELDRFLIELRILKKRIKYHDHYEINFVKRYHFIAHVISIISIQIISKGIKTLLTVSHFGLHNPK